MPDWNWEAIGAIGALLIAIGSAVYSFVSRQQVLHDEILRALQGEKESVGYIAFKMSQGELRSRRRSRRQDYIRALFNAYLFESADRARALILAALRQADRRDIVAVWLTVIRQFNEYRELVLVPRGDEKDIDKHYQRLDDLRRALSLSVDSVLPAAHVKSESAKSRRTRVHVTIKSPIARARLAIPIQIEIDHP
jgi:hypothetical protein